MTIPLLTVKIICPKCGEQQDPCHVKHSGMIRCSPCGTAFEAFDPGDDDEETEP